MRRRGYHRYLVLPALLPIALWARLLEGAWTAGVPPDEVETRARCTNGVAKFESRLGFLNLLVGWLTLRIYTPMEIRVTCAR